MLWQRIEGRLKLTVLENLRRRSHRPFLAQSKMESKRDITFSDFQSLIREMYYDKDAERGVDGTFMWLMDEVGELATALRSMDGNGPSDNLKEEFADVLAWLTTIANVAGVDLGEVIQNKYGTGCPGCGRLACTCPMEEKP